MPRCLLLIFRGAHKFQSGSHDNTWKFGLVLTLHINWPLFTTTKNKIINNSNNTIVAHYLVV